MIPQEYPLLNRCEHGVYIPTRRGLVVGSDQCSICQAKSPSLDRHYGIPYSNSAALPANLSNLYEYWMSSKDPLAYERLYYKIQDLAKSIAINMFQGNDSVPDYTEAAVDAATNCLLDIARYNGESSFSTWAHSCISHDLLDWHKMEVDDRFASLNDDEHPIDVPDRHSSVDEKLFLKEVRSHLSPDELRLFEMLAENMTYEQIGKIEGFSISGVQYREELLHKKILALSRNPGG